MKGESHLRYRKLQKIAVVVVIVIIKFPSLDGHFLHRGLLVFDAIKHINQLLLSDLNSRYTRARREGDLP